MIATPVRETQTPTEVPAPADARGKVSAAMRRGAALTAPGHGVFLRYLPMPRGVPRVAQTCALGAALVGALGLRPTARLAREGNTFDRTLVLWPELEATAAMCRWQGEDPYYPKGSTQRSLLSQVIQLNDERAASREEIADWLETLGL